VVVVVVVVVVLVVVEEEEDTRFCDISKKSEGSEDQENRGMQR
jgi:hypothetical protein